jgi:DNA-binding transcriptional MerR regulator
MDESDPRDDAAPGEPTYPVRAAARMTGLTPDLLRAWERRYGVVSPVRTKGGTRRYRASDLERLRLLKAASDAGHRIGELAGLDREALERRLASPSEAPTSAVEAVVAALGRLDGDEAERLISLQLAALGPVRFARELALPLLHEIGERWAGDRLCAASEHLGTALLRSLLGTALRPTLTSRQGPRIVFATPAGDRHELGLLIAALVALGAGGNPLYLGPELPVEELVHAVNVVGAGALALGITVLPAGEALAAVRALRAALPDAVELWIGGARARELALSAGAIALDSLETLERRVTLLALRGGLGSVR